MRHWNLEKSGNWYDFTVLSANFERRFSGRVESGKDSISDPAMAIGLSA
jgi:phospholipase C